MHGEWSRFVISDNAIVFMYCLNSIIYTRFDCFGDNMCKNITCTDFAAGIADRVVVVVGVARISGAITVEVAVADAAAGDARATGAVARDVARAAGRRREHVGASIARIADTIGKNSASIWSGGKASAGSGWISFAST